MKPNPETVRISRRRADAIREAMQAHRDRHGSRNYTLLTTRGLVELETVRAMSDAQGVTVVEVYVISPAGGDPHFRLICPPTLVADPSGNVHIGGKRYRADPLAALATVIASAGGAQSTVKRRRRG